MAGFTTGRRAGVSKRPLFVFTTPIRPRRSLSLTSKHMGSLPSPPPAYLRLDLPIEDEVQHGAS